MDNVEYLRQISVDETARITDTQGGATSTQINATANVLRWGSRRNVYNLELNNENNSPETVYLYTGDTTNNRRTAKRRYTLGNYATVCFFISITDPVMVWTPTNYRTAAQNVCLYGTVAANPVNVVVTYYDEYVTGTSQ